MQGRGEEHGRHTLSMDDAVKAYSCVDLVTKFTDEQYTTIKGLCLQAVDKDPRVETSCG